MESGTTTFIVLKELAGNPPPQLNVIQNILEPHTGLLTQVWTSVWIITAAVLIVLYWHEYKERKSERDD